MRRLAFLLLVFNLMVFAGCSHRSGDEPVQKPKRAIIFSAEVNGMAMSSSSKPAGLPVEGLVVTIEFSTEIDIEKFNEFGFNFPGAEYELSYGENRKFLQVNVLNKLSHFTEYTISIIAMEQLGVDVIETSKFSFSTCYDPSEKFEKIPDEELLTLVQERTFGYFWNYAHPVSGLSRERLNSGETVTVGGSGFGVMALPVGIERGFISREEGAERMARIVDFLLNKADRFHGAFPHWLDGTTGKTIAFSEYDDGADLVETALLMEGLLTVQQYFNLDNDIESAIRSGIQQLWEEVEWDWFLNGTESLYWHWSPVHGWKMNMTVSGWNEALIVYVLAASSPTHSITREAYDIGWARNGSFRNGNSYYDIVLPLGPEMGGPLFFAHYSFLGLDPRGLSDVYASYWEQNVAQTKINRAYCVANPKGYLGYGEDSWGLTASDIPGGYTASSPTNDRGTIAPTAALSSMPYTPQESMEALHYFYYILGDRLLGEYGFYDAFNLSNRWIASSCLAIDQGPIILMIENHRTGLLWNNFMKSEDVRAGLDKLGFEYNKTDI